MNIESAPLVGRGLVAPKKSFSSYVLRAVVVALLFAMIPGTPAFAAHGLEVTVFPDPDSPTPINTPQVVTTTVTTGNGTTPLAGAVVTWTAEDLGGGQPVPQNATSTTDANGVATMTFNSSAPGEATITATVFDVDEEVSDTDVAEWQSPDNADAEPESETNVVGEPHTVTVTVTAGGDPVSGTVVTWTAEDLGDGQPVPQNSTSTTDAMGRASQTFNSTRSGTADITATANGANDVVQKTWLAGPPSSLDLQPPAATNTAGDTHFMTATVRDEHGNLVEDGTVVTFTVTGAGATQTTATTSNGEALFQFSSDEVGDSQITATAGGTAQDTATKHWTPANPHVSICDNTNEDSFMDEPHGPAPDQMDSNSCDTTASNEVNNTHTVFNLVHDDLGNVPPSGTVVTFTLVFESADDDDSDPDSTTTVTRTTDENGRSEITFNSTKTGTTRITGTTIWDGVTVTSDDAHGDFVKTWTPGPITHYHFDFTSPQFAGICFPVTITAHDQFENLTNDGEPGGTELLVGSNDGNPDLFFFPGPNCNPNSARTEFNINGERRIFAMDFDNATGETVFITAVSPGGAVSSTSQALVIEAGGPIRERPDGEDQPGEGPCPGFPNDECPEGGEEPPPPPPCEANPNDPCTIDMDPETDTNNINEQHTIVATVRDEDGDPVSGVTVEWIADGTGGENPDSTSTTTDAQGRATFTFTSSAPGQSEIQATVPGSPAQGFAVKNWVDPDAEQPVLQDWFFGGGILVGGPDASSWAAGRLDVFVRGADNALWHKSWNGTQWSAWESLGGILTSDPTAVSWGPDRIDIFVRGADNAMWHMFWQNAWSGWEPLGGNLTSGPDASSWQAGRLDIFVRGGDNGLWHMYWDGSAWSPWEGLGGVITADPGAVSWSANRIDIFVRGADNGMWHLHWNGGAWVGWENLGGILDGGPDPASQGSGLLDIFVQGADDAMWQMTWNGSSWTGWTSHGGILTSSPGAVSWGMNRIDTFVRGGDNALWHKFFDPSDGHGGWAHESEF